MGINPFSVPSPVQEGDYLATREAWICHYAQTWTS